MNERIKLLAEQATEEVMRNTPSFLVTNEMWKEKFAELIIKETLDVARAGIEYGDGMDSAVYIYFDLKDD